MKMHIRSRNRSNRSDFGDEKDENRSQKNHVLDVEVPVWCLSVDVYVLA